MSKIDQDKQLMLSAALPAPAASLNRYISAVNAVPVLKVEEERDLLRAYLDHGDIEAAKKLVLAHLRFVVNVARSYGGYGLPLGDIIQEGNIGLMKALKRVELREEVRFVSFAVHWIKAEIHDYIIRNWRIVKIATTKAQRKLFFKMRSTRNSLGHLKENEVREIADSLEVDSREVRHMATRFRSPEISFEASATNDEGEEFSPQDYIGDKHEDPARSAEDENWNTSSQQALEAAFSRLDKRSGDIVRARYLNSQGKGATLQQLAKRHGISIERVRQLEKAALDKLRLHLDTLVA